MMKDFKLESIRKEMNDRYVISLGDIVVYTNPMYMAIHSISPNKNTIQWMGIFDQTKDLVTPEIILDDLREKTSNTKLFVNPGEIRLDPSSDASYLSLASYNNIVYTFEEFRVDYEGYLDYIDHNMAKIMKDWPNFKW